MPLGLDHIVGQPEVVRRLGAMLTRGRFPHAMLFTGPAGVGKLAAAHTLAQILLCPNRAAGSAEACDVCDACIKVKAELHADVHVVTTDERTLKVDDVRDATRSLQLHPMEGVGKVLIIPGAEVMNNQAQNALLKTLEEPPGTAYLILTTSRPRAILPTVLSRCQRVAFLPIPRQELADLLVRERAIPEGQALLLAAMAQGSLEVARSLEPAQVIEARDRAALFDQRLEPGRKNAVFEALEVSGDLGEDREELDTFLDTLMIWLRDQAVIASGASHDTVANLDRLPDLEALVERRGLRHVLDRTRVVLHAKRQLDLPFNLNRTMIAEQLCLGLSGQVRVPDAEERRR